MRTPQCTANSAIFFRCSTTRRRRSHLLWGGDLNITRQWVNEEARYREWEKATFARIAAFGLVDVLDRKRHDGPLAGCGCADGEECRHIRTQRHDKSPRPWQNDYISTALRHWPQASVWSGPR